MCKGTKPEDIGHICKKSTAIPIPLKYTVNGTRGIRGTSGWKSSLVPNWRLLFKAKRLHFNSVVRNYQEIYPGVECFSLRVAPLSWKYLYFTGQSLPITKDPEDYGASLCSSCGYPLSLVGFLYLISSLLIIGWIALNLLPFDSGLGSTVSAFICMQLSVYRLLSSHY